MMYIIAVDKTGKTQTEEKVMKTITITYNGFHGRNSFRMRANVEKIDTVGTGYNNNDTVIVDLSDRQIARINRIVGCRIAKTVFGVDYPILGACGCGEGIDQGQYGDQPVYAQIDGDNHYYIRGRYPQN
jgi:hypothetical protein